MSYNVEYTVRETHVEAVVSGRVEEFHELSSLVRGFVEKLKESGKKRFLTLERDLQLDIAVYDVVLLAEEVVKAGVQTRGLKVASHYEPANKFINEAFETSHQNRSLNFRAFAEQEAAIKWLLS